MGTNTTVCHGCRKAGNPSSPAPFLSLPPLFPSPYPLPPYPCFPSPHFSFSAGCSLSVLLFLSHPLASTVSTIQVLCFCTFLCLFFMLIWINDGHSNKPSLWSFLKAHAPISLSVGYILVLSVRFVHPKFSI